MKKKIATYFWPNFSADLRGRQQIAHDLYIRWIDLNRMQWLANRIVLVGKQQQLHTLSDTILDMDFGVWFW